MDFEARINISLREGKLEISGSEQFVREQLEIFRPLLESKLSTISTQPPPGSPHSPGGTAGTGGSALEGMTSENPYLNVIAFDEDRIKILKTPPGKTDADKMVNLSLLYLLGASLKGVESISFGDLRNVCQEHACLDSSNFSAAMRRAKEYFILSGKGKSQSAKLTHPGKKAVEELAKELNEK